MPLLPKNEPTAPARATLATVDNRLSAWIVRQAEAAPGLRRVARLSARAGDGIVWLGIAAGAMLAPPLRSATAQIALGALAAGLAVAPVKYTVRRTRPAGARYRSSAIWAHYDAYSFPSGHAARMAALATGAALLFPGCWPLLLIGAALVCWGRVATAAHFVGDVLAGALLGAVAAVLIYLLGPGALIG